MPDRIRINDEIIVGAQPSEAELKAMADGKTKSVINLRTEDEEMQPISPEEEGRIAGELGLEYVSIPVSMEKADAELVDRFCKELKTVAKPVFVHCRLGKRAGAFVMMDQAVQKGMSGKNAIQAAEDMGFECDQEALAAFVKDYVNERTS